MIIQIGKKTFDGNTANEKQKKPWSLFHYLFEQHLLLLSLVLQLQMKNYFFCLHNSCMPFNKVVWPFPCEWVNLNVTISVSFDTKVISFVHKTRRQLLD